MPVFRPIVSLVEFVIKIVPYIDARNSKNCFQNMTIHFKEIAIMLVRYKALRFSGISIKVVLYNVLRFLEIIKINVVRFKVLRFFAIYLL